MPDRRDTVTLLSDLGSTDELVGVVRSVLRDLAPHATTVDLTHDIAPHDVRGASLALARAIQYVAPGVVLALVDPGVGTERKAVAVEVAGGNGVVIGPDNGVLAPAVAMAGGAERAVALTNEAWHLPSPGVTFAARDVFAPCAAALCNGADLLELGDEVDAALLMPGVVPVSRIDGDELVCEVLWVDRFGNAQLNVGPDEIEPFGDTLRLRISSATRTAQRASTYGAIRGGSGIGLVVDSYGLVSVCIDRRSAADELGLAAGDEVRLSEASDDAGRVGSVPVSIDVPRRG